MVDEKTVAKGLDRVIKKYEAAQMRIFEKIVRDFFSIKWLLVCIAVYAYQFGYEVPLYFSMDGFWIGLRVLIATFLTCSGAIFILYAIILGVPRSILKYREQLYAEDDFEGRDNKN